MRHPLRIAALLAVMMLAFTVPQVFADCSASISLGQTTGADGNAILVITAKGGGDDICGTGFEAFIDGAWIGQTGPSYNCKGSNCSYDFLYPLGCKRTGTYTATVKAKCGRRFEDTQNCYIDAPGYASAPFTVNTTPEIAISAAEYNPATNKTTVSIDYNFPNVAGDGGFRLRNVVLYAEDGGVIKIWDTTPEQSGTLTHEVNYCGEVTAVATACRNFGDPLMTSRATAQLPDDPCKRDRDECAMPGRPVNVGSGDVSLNLPLFSISQTPLPLSFGLAYHSARPAYGSIAGEVAPGWTHSFNPTLRLIRVTGADGIVRETRAYGIDENGRERFYVDEGAQGIWRPVRPADVHEELTRVGAELRLRDNNGTVRAFDAATGRWLSTTDRWNNSIRATYDASGNLSALTDSVGRVITIVASGSRIAQMTLPNGAVWSFAYGGNGELVSISDPLHAGAAAWRTFTYQNDSRGVPRLLTAMRDDAGALLEGHTYDGAGRGITSFLEANREMVTLQYDNPSAGKTRVTHTIDDTKTQVSIFTLGYIGGRYRPTRVEGGCGTCGIIGDTEDREYDSSGNLTRRVAGDGTVMLQGFNANGNVVSRTEAAGTSAQRTVLYEFGLSTWPAFATKITEPAAFGSRVTTQSWSAGETVLTHNVTGKLSAGGADVSLSTATTFDARHRLIRTDGPRTDVTDVTVTAYHADDASDVKLRGRPSTLTDAVGNTATYSAYDLYGTPAAIRDVNDVVTTTETDARGHVIRSTSHAVAGNPDESADYVTARTFDSRDRLIEVTSPRGNRVRSVYESGTNLIVDTIVADASGNERERRHLTRNIIGNITREELQSCASPAPVCAAWTTMRTENYVYDGQNRRTQVVNADGTKKLYTYDAVGRVKTEQDENHTAANTTYTYDPFGRLASTSRKLGGGSALTSYTYNLDGFLLSVTDPNGNATQFEYDDFGRRTKMNSPVTGVSTESHDAAGNVVESTMANGIVYSMTWDALSRMRTQTAARSGVPAETITWTYDGTASFGKGRLLSMRDPSGTTQWTYERRGLVTSEQKTIGTAAYSTGYGYDAGGNRNRIVYPSGRIVNYTFDYADRPYSAVSGSTSIVNSASYLPFGPVREIAFGNGTTQTMAYDSRYQISQNRLTGPSGTLADYAYGHDSAGNVSRIYDSTDPAYNRDFGYDDLHRLVTANTGTALWGNGTYAYDAMGNMLSLSLGTSRNATFQYEGTTPKLTAVTENGTPRSVAYDAGGNETAVGTSTFEYSARNKLSGADGYTYSYDGRGLRTTTGAKTPLQTISFAQATVTGGTASTLTISLSSPAPAGGLTVHLISDDAAATPPASAVVPEGSTSTTVNVATSPVGQPRNATIEALANADRRVATLAIQPPAPLSLALQPATVTSGASSAATLTMNGPAPAGGFAVALSSSNPAALVPAQVTVAAGAITANFTVTTIGVATLTQAVISAGTSAPAVATLTVQPAQLAALQLNPSSLIGGNPSTGTVTLDGLAGASGTTVTLASNSGTATVPATVRVTAGAASATFTVNTTQVTARLTARITATLNSASQTADLMIETPNNTPPVASFVFNCAGLACSFDASATTDAEGQPLTYDWLLGTTPIGTGVALNYTFPPRAPTTSPCR